MLPAVDILPDEGIPLLSSHSHTCDYELLHVHCQNKPAVKKSAGCQNKWTVECTHSSDGQYLTDQLFSTVQYEDNVVETLRRFWQKKAQQAQLVVEAGSSVSDGAIKYEIEPVAVDCDSRRHICFVELPGGCCFASPLECSSPVEAQHEAARVALINSILNELPSRRITESFIKLAVSEAEQLQSTGQGLDAYQFVLESTLDQTILDYTALVNRLRIMHWCGKLQTLNADGATRQDVLRLAQSDHWLSDECKSAMACHWVAVERSAIDLGARSSIIKFELEKSLQELHEARRIGLDVAFPRLKRDVLRLAERQLVVV